MRLNANVLIPNITKSGMKHRSERLSNNLFHCFIQICVLLVKPDFLQQYICTRLFPNSPSPVKKIP